MGEALVADAVELRFVASTEAIKYAPIVYGAADVMRRLVSGLHPGGVVPPGRRRLHAELPEPTLEQRAAELQPVVFTWPYAGEQLVVRDGG